MALKYVPEKFKTPEMCLAAVQKFGFMLEYVPEKLKTLIRIGSGICSEKAED